MNTGISYYRFKDKAHADAMLDSVSTADEKGLRVFEKGLTFFDVPPRGTTTGEGEAAVFTPFAEYIIGCVNYASILPIDDWDQWHIPSDRITHTVLGREEDQEALDELATDIDETAPIPDTVPTRLELTEELQALRVERAEAYALVVDMRAERDRKRNQLDRTRDQRDATVVRRDAKVAHIATLNDSLPGLRSDRDAQVAIAQDTNASGPDRIAARGERDRLNQLIADTITERDINVAELGGLNDLIVELNDSLQALIAEVNQLNTDLQTERTALQATRADIDARREALRNP